MMSEVGTDEATLQFPELLQRAAEGEEITVTRQGVPIAKLIPASSSQSVKSRRRAIQELEQLAKGRNLGGSRSRI